MLDNQSRVVLKGKITDIGFICQLVPHIVHIWHQLSPGTAVSCHATIKDHPKYYLPLMSPQSIIWPISKSTVVLMWNWYNWIPWNMCGWKYKTHRLPVLVNPWLSMMIYFPTVDNYYHCHSVYKYIQGKNKWLIHLIFTKLHNAIYATWVWKNMYSTLCSTTVITQIQSSS